MSLQVKAGVAFTVITPAGFRLLGAIERTARHLQLPLTITCGCDGHPPSDPHMTGDAYDVRAHGLTEDQKQAVLHWVMVELIEGTTDAALPTGIGVATRHFYGQREDPGGANEHFHFQRRKGTTYR